MNKKRKSRRGVKEKKTRAITTTSTTTITSKSNSTTFSTTSREKYEAWNCTECIDDFGMRQFRGRSFSIPNVVASVRTKRVWRRTVVSERGIGEYNRKYSSRGTEPAIAAHVEDAVYVSVRSYLLYRGGESPPSLLRFSAPFTFSHSPSLSLSFSVTLSICLSPFLSSLFVFSFSFEDGPLDVISPALSR